MVLEMELEMEWNSRLIMWNFQMENFRQFAKFHTIPFHFHFNSTFHLKMETSGGWVGGQASGP